MCGVDTKPYRGLHYFIAQKAITLTTFGHRLTIHPAVINTHSTKCNTQYKPEERSHLILTDEIWVRDTVNTNFMEGVLLFVSTGVAPGSIYCLTLFYVRGYFAVCTILDPVRSLVRGRFCF